MRAEKASKNGGCRGAVSTAYLLLSPTLSSAASSPVVSSTLPSSSTLTLSIPHFQLDHVPFTFLIIFIHVRVFKHSAEEVDVRDNGTVDAEWMAYLGAFRNLRYLNLADCHRITTSALWPIAGVVSIFILHPYSYCHCLRAGSEHDA